MTIIRLRLRSEFIYILTFSIIKTKLLHLSHYVIPNNELQLLKLIRSCLNGPCDLWWIDENRTGYPNQKLMYEERHVLKTVTVRKPSRNVDYRDIIQWIGNGWLFNGSKRRFVKQISRKFYLLTRNNSKQKEAEAYRAKVTNSSVFFETPETLASLKQAD